MKFLPLLIAALLAITRADAADPPYLRSPGDADIFAPENLHAWCVVPFDAKKRGPEERAAMLKTLGFRRFVYDWRAKDIPTFDAEIEALKKHGIELTAWWSPTDSRDPTLLKILEVFRRQNVHPQLWVMGGGPATRSAEEYRKRVEEEAERIRRIVQVAAPYGCKVELYNHNGWFGEPDNEVAVINRLRELGVMDVGMVYNFSHGHNDIADFPAIWKRIKPYVVALNLTGMVKDGESKLMPPSQGDFELGMMRVVLESGWRGPVGLIAEQGGDAAVTLSNNLRGLEWLRKELVEPGSGGERPRFGAPEVKQGAVLVHGRFNKALDAANGGLLLPGQEQWRGAPITVEAWAKLRNARSFNVVVASDTKVSGAHWELYSFAQTGDFSIYLPGRDSSVRSGLNICDDAWHHLAMVLEEERVRLFVDGRMVKEQSLPSIKRAIVPGELGIGRTVEDGIGCDGLVDDVRISRGIREVNASPAAALIRDDATVELWNLDELPKHTALPEREPLDQSAHPLSRHPINRDRIYDFYAKQARDFASNTEKPALLPAFPGLDGGRSGHWGNQTEATWESNRWNKMEPGSVQAGVFRHAGRTVARAVCVKLDNAAVCFDPDTLSWPEAWRGGFVRFGTARFGFLGGIDPAGSPIATPAGQSPTTGTYRGFYRHGERVVFVYERDRETWLELASGSAGGVVITREKLGEGNLTALTHGGPGQWPQVFQTAGILGGGKPYAIDTLTVPSQTPWRSLWHFSGHDFFPNGDAALCTFEGEVWIVSGIDENLGQLKWKRFASGLHQPLGLNVVEGKICVLGRNQITRLHDLNNDGEADYYECVSNSYQTPTGGHDFVTGLQHDALGRFYLASGTQGVVRVTPGANKAEVLATGFRNPDGIGLGPNGEVAVAVQEGDWTPASMIYEFSSNSGEAPGHYGYGGPRPGARGHLPPLAYLPRGEDHSCGGQCYVTSNRWSVPMGTLVHFSWGNGTAFLILRERTGGIAQGCVVPIPGDFSSGAHRGAFHPRDGQLYVSGMTGWITYAPEEGSFQRMRYTGGSEQAPIAIEARENGLLLRFAQPLDKSLATDRTRFFAQQWNYHYSAAYGSDEYSVQWPDRRGHDPLAIGSVHLKEEGRVLFIEIPGIQKANLLHLHCDLPDLLSRDLYLTLHQLGPAFTQFPNYRTVAKSVPGMQPDTAVFNPEILPVKWEQGEEGRRVTVQTGGGLQFLQKEIHAKAGERLSLTFENPDAMQHNWVLVKAGAAERVGDLANRLISEPGALARHYVPDSPDVLCHTRMLDPQKTTTIYFTAPEKAGRYPYLCTFPGHWMLMRGELVVE